MDSDVDVLRITAEMLSIHYLVSISHFAECRENQPVSAREVLIDLLKSSILQW